MTSKKIIAGIGFAVIGGPLSIFLAMKSEDMALQYKLWNGTPGMLVGNLIYPPGTSGLNTLGPEIAIEALVDASIWFLLICSTAFLISRYRRKHNGN